MLPDRSPPELLGQSPAFLDMLAHISAAAPLNRPLLIAGERGAGKELVAERLHFLSPRWEGPFLKVNCAALSDDLLESELFGHEAGAFTGARSRHAGRFERADGGTLFLDEIASASARVQEKLLRVIEYGEFERVGGEKTLRVNVRVIAAANVDLRALAARGAFRADLLDRLAFDVVVAPPLRARPEDVALLAAHFAAGMAREMGLPFPGFTAEAMETLKAHPWPGNVRELKNAAERSFYRWVAADGDGPVGSIALDPFEDANAPPPSLSGGTAPGSEDGDRRRLEPPRLERKAGQVGFDLRRRLDEIEKAAAIDALAASGGNQKKAAALLRLTYDQMRGIVRKHGLGG